MNLDVDDVVVDTCVMAHSCNEQSSWNESSHAVVVWLREDESVSLVLDDTGRGAPQPHTSVLYGEYISTLGPQSAPIVLLAMLLASGRVIFAPRPPRATREAIQRLVPQNKRDRCVLGAAATSVSKVLISNDYTDFPVPLRRKVGALMQVRVLDSDECV